MDGHRKSVRRVFDEALEIHDVERRKLYLAEACAGDTELRREVEELLSNEAAAGGFLADPPRDLPGADAGSTEREGDRIGRYRILQKIGEGGFGVVYLAEQTEPVKRRVALKVIKPGMDTRSVVARFEAERQAVALMDHPCVARVLDAGATEAGRPYFVMEWVRGTRITAYCDEHSLSTVERLRLFVQVCQAVQHAHQKGIIHRDLKPSNILVTRQDDAAVPKVIDFGIAKATTGVPLTEKTLVTRLEHFIGTPTYMSPEQAGAGSLDIDTRTDIYALGVLLYELLTGSPPFEPADLLSQGIEGMLRTIRERDPPRPSTRLANLLGSMEAREAGAVGGISEPTPETNPAGLRRRQWLEEQIAVLRGDLDWIVLKAIEKDRTRRYETAHGLAKDVERYLANEPVIARPPSTAYRVRKAWTRNRLAWTAISAAAVALVVGAVGSAWAAFEATRAKEAALRAGAAQAVAARQAEAERDKARKLQRRAEAGERSAQQLLYAADMHLARQAWEENNPGGVRRLLQETAAYPVRGFEWYYWLRQTHLETRVFSGDLGRLETVAFFPDGRRIITAGHEGAVIVWDSTRGERLQTLLGHTGKVAAVAILPLGDRIVTVGSDGTGRIWDVVLGKELARLVGHTDSVSSVACTPDGRRIVTAAWDGTVRVWEADTAREILALRTGARRFHCVAISPDGREVAAGNEQGTAELWELSSGKRLGSLVGHEKHVYAMAFSPEGERLVTGSADRSFRVWDLSTGKCSLSVRGHSDRVMAVAFSPDGKRILTGSDDHTAKVWDAVTGRELNVLQGHANIVLAAVFSPDGRHVLTGSHDQTAKLWAASSEVDRQTFRGHRDTTTSVAFSPDGSRAVSGSKDGTAKVWSCDGAAVLLDLRGHREAVGAVAYSPDGRTIVTGSDDGTAKVWDAEHGIERFTLAGHTHFVRAVGYSPDGRFIVTGGADGSARIWNVLDRREVLVFRGHAETINSAVFSRDGRRVLTASRDRSVRLWDAATGREELVLSITTAGFEGVHSAAFSPDERHVVTAGGVVATVWDVATGGIVSTLVGHHHELFSAVYSPDGQRLLTASDDQSLRVWEVSTGHEVLSLRGHTEALHCLAVSADGRSALTGGEDTTVRLWKAATDEEASRWSLTVPDASSP